MSYEKPTPVIECQDCGMVLEVLTGEQAQRVAERPYDFVRYCHACAWERQR